MDILIWMAVGIGAGLLAHFVLMDGRGGGIVGNMVVGVLGAVLAGWVMSLFGTAGASGVNAWSLIIAFAGAAALLWAGRAFTGSGTLN